MRSPLRRMTVELFRKKMKEQFPLFEPISKGKESPMWSLRITARLTFFILLSIPHDYDKFYVEIAWSNDGEFPWDRHSEVVKAELPKCRQRLQYLWSNEDNSPWSIVPELSHEERMKIIMESDDDDDTPLRQPDPPLEEALKRVPPLVEDAVNKVVEYAIPLFKKVTEHRKLKWPSA